MKTKFKRLKAYPYPCRTVEKVFYSYGETAGLDNFEMVMETRGQDGKRYDPKEMIEIMLTFQGDTYMEITQTRAIDGQSLIGNAGGYVGLFLGVALLQLPSAILCVVHFFGNLSKNQTN